MQKIIPLLVMSQKCSEGKGLHFCFVITPKGVLWISGDGFDQRTFLGLKFSIPGFFWVGKKYPLFV